MKRIILINLLLSVCLYSEIPLTGKKSIENRKNNHQVWMKLAKEYETRSKDKPESKKIIISLIDEFAKNKCKIPGYKKIADLMPNTKKIPLKQPMDPFAKCILGEVWLEGSGRTDAGFKQAFALLDQGYNQLAKSNYSVFAKFIGSKWLKESLLYSNRIPRKKFQNIKDAYVNNMLAFITQETEENEQRFISDHMMVFMGDTKEFPTTEKFYNLFIKNPGKCKPWLKEMTTATYHSKKGWHARGSGYANSVSNKGFELFAKHSKISGEHLKKAYKLNPERPEAATRLISVSMEGGTEEHSRYWFDKVVEAEVDYDRAYSSLLWAYRPRWGGSIQEMAAFGRECAETNLYDTKVPYFYIKAVVKIREETDYETVEKMGLYEKMHEVFKQYGKLESENKLHLFTSKNYFRSWHFCYAVKLNKFSHIKKLYQLYGDELYDKATFENYGLIFKHEVARAYAMDGPASALISKIHDTFSWTNVTQDSVVWPTLQQVKNFNDDIRDIEGMTTDKEAKPYIDQLKRLIGMHLKYYNGEWVDFTFKEGFPLWKNYGGNWQIIDEKTVIGETYHNEHQYLSSNVFFKGPFIVEADIESIKSSSRGGVLQAGIMTGRNFGSTGRSFWIDNLKKKAGWTVPREKPNWIKISNKTKKSKLTMYVWDGFWQLYVNDGTETFWLDDPKFKTLKIGLGIAPTWKVTGKVKYSNFRIKKIDLLTPIKHASAEEQEAFYSKMIKENGFDYLNHSLGVSYYHNKKYQKAIETLKIADKKNPDWFKPLMIASSYDFLKKFDEALSNYETAFKRSRKDQHGLKTCNNYLAFMLSTCQDEKIRDPERALKLSLVSVKGKLDLENKSRFMSTLACCYAATGNFKKAIETVDTVLKIEKDEESIKELKEKKELFKQNKPYLNIHDKE